MKKLFTLALLAAVLPASAAITDTGKRMKESPRFINSQFTYSNKALLLVDEENYDNDTYKFTILDKSFTTIKEFSTPQYPEVTATYTVRYAIEAPTGITEAYQGINFENSMPAEAFAEWYANERFTRTEKHGDETWYLSEEPDRYYYYEYYKYQYPRFYRVYNANEQIAREYFIEYNYENWGPTGQYGEPEEQYDSTTPCVIRLYPQSEECGDMESILITQTLFNTDETFEWLVSMPEAVDVSYTNEREQVSGKRIRNVGFKVLSENGSTVAEVRYPAGYTGSHNDELDMLIVDGSYYIMANVSNESHTEDYYIIYEVSKGTNSIKMVGEPMRVKVYPTAPVRGTDVKVELGETVGERCTVSVVSVSGRTVLNRSIEPGTTYTTINTDNMQQGVYIVNVNDDRGQRTATKIVIR